MLVAIFTNTIDIIAFYNVIFQCIKTRVLIKLVGIKFAFVMFTQSVTRFVKYVVIIAVITC